jgi:hypothetical protein
MPMLDSCVAALFPKAERLAVMLFGDETPGKLGAPSPVHFQELITSSWKQIFFPSLSF